jgi:DNA mismatch repair ATPase MutL
MKLIQTTAFAVILALAGVSVARAQEPEPDKEKQKQQEEEKKKQPSAKEQPKSDESKAQPHADKDKDKNKEKQDVDRQKQQTDEREDKKKADQRQYSSQSAPGGNAQRGDRKSVRKIPQEKFQVSFGREHHFHVQKRDDRRVQYGGYVFEYEEAWPAVWSWDDDFYIEEDGDDYYLVDVVHPEARILVVIVG